MRITEIYLIAPEKLTFECILDYSRLPISNPRVINRTEVEVPYLGD